MVKDTTLYDRLGLLPNATESEIKREGSKLSRKWHPDKNIDNAEEASTKFKEIREAMEILLDTEKRNLYDQIGMDVFDTPSQPEHPFHPFSFFSQENRQPIEPIIKTVDIHLEQIYNEDSIPLSYERLMKCSYCSQKQKICNECNGNKVKIQLMRMGPMVQQRMVPCMKCKGKGKSSQCQHCNGTCEMTQTTQIQFKLKNGLVDGMALTLQGKGHIHENMPGDLIIKIKEKPHPVFKRYGKNNLIMTISLNLYEALFGFSREIQHLDGSLMYLSHLGKTEYDSKKYIMGAGMTHLKTSEPGDLVIRFVFELPMASPETIHDVLMEMKPSFTKDEKSVEMQLYDYEEDVDSNSSDDNINENHPHSHPQECRTM